MTEPALWSCQIGWADRDLLPPGSDAPMRRSVELAFSELTGQIPRFTFSGWGDKLPEKRLALVENRDPDPLTVARSTFAELRAVLDHMGTSAELEGALKLIGRCLTRGSL